MGNRTSKSSVAPDKLSSPDASKVPIPNEYQWRSPDEGSLLAAATPKVTKIRVLRNLFQKGFENGKINGRIEIPKGAVLPVTGSFKNEILGPGFVVSYTDDTGQTFTGISIHETFFTDEYPDYEKITDGGRRRKNRSKRRKNLRTRRIRKHK